MITACATHIPLPRIPAHVTVIRDGRRLSSPPHSTGSPTPPGTTPTPRTTTPPGITTTPGLFLQVGDRIRVTRPAVFTFAYAGNRFRIPHGQIRLECRNLALSSRRNGSPTTVLAVSLQSGRVRVRSGVDPRRALVLSPEMLAFATVHGTNFAVDRNPAARSTRAWTLDQLIVAAKASDQALRINTRITYTAISDTKGLRLDIWPFSISPLQRPTTPTDGLVPYWADGLRCSVGCTAPGAIPGWPLRPFHEQHAIRAGINELRPANFHVAVDIEANNFQRVYAIQSGYASIRYPSSWRSRIGLSAAVTARARSGRSLSRARGHFGPSSLQNPASKSRKSRVRSAPAITAVMGCAVATTVTPALTRSRSGLMLERHAPPERDRL